MSAAQRESCPECDANLFPADIERGTCPACGADLQFGEGGGPPATGIEQGEIAPPDGTV